MIVTAALIVAYWFTQWPLPRLLSAHPDYNFYLVQQVIRQVRQYLPAGYYRQLPLTSGAPPSVLPRVYVLASELIAASDLVVDLIAHANPSLYVSRPLDVFHLNFSENLKIAETCACARRAVDQRFPCNKASGCRSREADSLSYSTLLDLSPGTASL